MDRARLRELVIAGLKKVQEVSLRPWRELGDDSRAVGVLDGFDSISGIEATSEIEGLLNKEKPGAKINAETLFVDGRRALTLFEAVEFLAKTITGA